VDIIGAFQEDLRRNGLSACTREAYISDINNFFHDLPDGLPITPERTASIRRSDICRYLQDQSQRGLSVSTVKRRYCAVTRFFLFAVEQGFVATNPAADLDFAIFLSGGISTEQIIHASTYLTERHLSSPQGDSLRYLRNHIAWLFMILSGVRQSQLPLLKISGIGEEDGAITFTLPDEQVVKLDPPFVRLLQRYLELRSARAHTILLEPKSHLPIARKSVTMFLTELSYVLRSECRPKLIHRAFRRLAHSLDERHSILEALNTLSRDLTMKSIREKNIAEHITA
jgi:site-specific recombinase XerD